MFSNSRPLRITVSVSFHRFRDGSKDLSCMLSITLATWSAIEPCNRSQRVLTLLGWQWVGVERTARDVEGEILVCDLVGITLSRSWNESTVSMAVYLSIWLARWNWTLGVGLLRRATSFIAKFKYILIMSVVMSLIYSLNLSLLVSNNHSNLVR
jgi:hypothetical protein